MSAYIDLRRRHLVEIPITIFRGFVTLLFSFDTFTIFYIPFLTSELMLMRASSRLTAWILNVEQLALEVRCALIRRSLSTHGDHSFLSTILVQVSAVSRFSGWKFDVCKDTKVMLNALLSILNLFTCLHSVLVRSLEVSVGANTWLLAWIGNKVKLTLRDGITLSLVDTPALLDHLFSASICILMGTYTKRMIWLLEIIELAIRDIFTSSIGQLYLTGSHFLGITSN